MVSRGRRSAFVLLLAVAGGALASCGRDVLVAGVSGPAPDAGRPGGGAGGQSPGTARVPVCDESSFNHEGLPGVQLASQLASDLAGSWTAPAVTGDWNHDGALDIAVPNYDLSTISVALGNPDGTFRPRTDYATGLDPMRIAARDLNGDGSLDLVVVNFGSASATVLLGRGDGTFAARVDYPTVGAMPAVVAIGEWTNDGKPDFIAGDTLFVGKGDGTFARRGTYGYVPDALATADLDGDGKLDLVGVQIDTAYSLLARGDGTFLRKSAFQLGEYGARPTLADLNGDRVPDLVIVGGCPNRSNSAFYLMMGVGDGTFRVTQMSDVDPCSVPVGVGDVNGDGKTDLQFGLRYTWFGNGDGTFIPFLSDSPNQGDTFVSLADWNEDGRLDVAVLDANAVLKTLPGDGTGRFDHLRSVSLAYPAYSPLVAQLVDLDLDGRLDLALLSYYGIEIFQGNGDGTFATERPYLVPNLGSQSEELRAADVNGDGAPDLILSPGPGFSAPVTVLLNLTHAFGFGPPLSAPVAGGFGALGDMDGDGVTDLIVVAYDISTGQNVLTTLFGAGDWTFGRAVQTPLRVGLGPSLFADLDGDGRLDAVVSSGYGQGPPTMWRFKGNADGSFSQQDDGMELPQPPEAGPIAIGDLNGDGQQDVVVADTSGAVAVYPGAGEGTFAPTAVYSPGGPRWSGWTVMALIDLNGDGALDLVGNEGAVLLGRGDGTFACAEAVSPDISGEVAFGDVNHDGKTDAVTVSGGQTSATLTVLLAR